MAKTNVTELNDGIYWVGAIDWNLRDFHGYVTTKGTTYNSYLIVDEKIALVDTVKYTHTDEMLRRIREWMKEVLKENNSCALNPKENGSLWMKQLARLEWGM